MFVYIFVDDFLQNLFVLRRLYSGLSQRWWLTFTCVLMRTVAVAVAIAAVAAAEDRNSVYVYVYVYGVLQLVYYTAFTRHLPFANFPHRISSCHLHWPCQSQSHAQPLSLHATTLTPWKVWRGRNWVLAMGVNVNVNVGGQVLRWILNAEPASDRLRSVSWFSRSIAGYFVLSTKDTLHFNEDIRRCGSQRECQPHRLLGFS